MLARKQYVQQQEEENIKEQQRRLAEERARMRREYESNKSYFISTNHLPINVLNI